MINNKYIHIYIYIYIYRYEYIHIFINTEQKVGRKLRVTIDKRSVAQAALGAVSRLGSNKMLQMFGQDVPGVRTGCSGWCGRAGVPRCKYL